MYTGLFKLTELPFRLSPDPQFLYLSKNHARAKAYMESTIWFTDGFVVITGEIGAGKTTLIETFLRELEKDVVVAQINQTQVSAIEFLQAVLVQFGFTPFNMKKAELLSTLNDFLIEQYAAGRKVLLIVDEAQNLSLRVLEEIRMLSGIETTKEKVLRIILAGQPELNAKLDSPELVQLAQRVRLRFHLTPLTPDDMHAYVLHRLDVAGSGGRQIFEEGCYPLIFRYTGGVPRLVNTLCETAMVAAYTNDRDFVIPADVESAIEELQWPDFETRAARQAQALRAAGNRFGNVPPADDSAFTRTSPSLHITDDSHPEPPRTEPLAYIMVVTEGRTVGELALRPGRTVVGRTPDNDLQIDSRFISRHHCQIISRPDNCVIEDLNSTNGITVRSRRVRTHNLNDGDVVVIGHHELMYIDMRNRPAGSTPASALTSLTGQHAQTVVLVDAEEGETTRGKRKR